MDQLLALDRYLFGKINLDWTNGFFDWLFPAITDLHKTPAFLFAVLPALAFWIFRRRTEALKWILVMIVAAGISDAFSYRVLKATTMRLRPVETGMAVQLRTHHHSGSSFPSNHSANVFASAAVLSAAIPTAAPVWFLIAAAVGYSRVYVGVHFPLDVLAGAFVGIAIAMITMRVFRRWIGSSSREQSSNRSS